MTLQADPADRLQHVRLAVIKYTQSIWCEHLVALYEYGSAPAGEIDGWTDLDLCLIYTWGDAGRSTARTWSKRLVSRHHYLADPMPLPADQLGPDASWEFAPFLSGLSATGQLLLGRDVRPQIAPPPHHHLGRAACQAAGLALRLLCGLSRADALPATLPIPDPAAIPPLPMGNAAWQLYRTTAAVLRALCYLEGNRLVPRKSQLAGVLAELGDPALQAAWQLATRARAALPRFGDLTPGHHLAGLARTIPPLAARYQRALDDSGLTDPAHEP